jgi:twitching motility protein PilI
MDKRQKLRDMQTRLAEKLQAVRTGELKSSAAWLAVECGAKKYLFPLGQSGEIFAWAPVQKVAHTQDWYQGVVNMRGALYGVVDFNGFVHRTRTIINHESGRTEARFVTFNNSLEVNCALCVDRLLGLRSTESFVESHQPYDGSPVFYGHMYVDTNGLSWQEINLQVLSQQDSFLNINA